MLECGQRLRVFTLSHIHSLDLGQRNTCKLAFAYASTHPPQQQQFWERCGCRHLHCNALICIFNCLIWINAVWKMNLKEKSTWSQWEALWESLVPVGSTSKERKSERTDRWRGRSRKRGRGWIYIASRSGETDRKSDTERDSAGIIITRGLGVGRSVYSNQRRKKRERERER